MDQLLVRGGATLEGTLEGSWPDYPPDSWWPVKVLDGRHLHMLHDPSAVGSSIVELLSQLDVTRSA